MKINTGLVSAEYDSTKSGWVVGNSPLNVTMSDKAADYFPWQYEIIFTSNDTAHSTRITKTSLLQEASGASLRKADVLLDQSFNFYVINKSFKDSTGEYIKMDMFVHDIDHDGMFNPDSDRVIVGPPVEVSDSRIYWGGTLFSTDFMNITNEDEMPQPNDVYRIDFNRPFTETDSVLFKILPETVVNDEKLENEMDKIKVVPNPYVATNTMETALSNPNLNQRRKLLFTHVPALCSIKIFTASGVFVDEIEVQNSSDNGIIHWDMLTHEDLEIAAGIYVYYIKSGAINKEKIGKFAVIK